MVLLRFYILLLIYALKLWKLSQMSDNQGGNIHGHEFQNFDIYIYIDTEIDYLPFYVG